jgi:hypothetical protein
LNHRYLALIMFSTVIFHIVGKFLVEYQPRYTVVQVVYDTSTGTATTAAHCGSLLEGLRLSTLK